MGCVNLIPIVYLSYCILYIIDDYCCGERNVILDLRHLVPRRKVVFIFEDDVVIEDECEICVAAMHVIIGLIELQFIRGCTMVSS